MSACRTGSWLRIFVTETVSGTSATRILDTLERRGIVRRRRAQEDRRAVAVTLTEPGRELLLAQEQWVNDRRRGFLASLAPDQREFVPELLAGWPV